MHQVLWCLYRQHKEEYLSEFTLFRYILEEISKEVESGWAVKSELVDIPFCSLQVYFSDQILFEWGIISELWIMSCSWKYFLNVLLFSKANICLELDVFLKGQMSPFVPAVPQRFVLSTICSAFLFPLPELANNCKCSSGCFTNIWSRRRIFMRVLIK